MAFTRGSWEVLGVHRPERGEKAKCECGGEAKKYFESRERKNMRRYIVYELLPGLVYGDVDAELNKFRDAFAITINNLLERVDRLGQDDA